MEKINYEEMREILKMVADIFREIGINWEVIIDGPYDGEFWVRFKLGEDAFVAKAFLQEMEPVYFWKSLSQHITSGFVKQAPKNFISALWASEEEGRFRVVFWIWTKNKDVISWYAYPCEGVIYIQEEGKEEKVPHTYDEYLRRLIGSLALAWEVYKHDND